MQALTDKRVLLGVTGGIAAYKSAELVRELRRAGADVRVVMTPAAGQFIAPMTLQALSGHPVRSELFDPAHEAAMGHIELARWADLVLVAPASADFLARLTAGMADDLLSTLCLATEAPLVVAPAMNRQMWLAAATVDNVARLASRGIHRLGPAEGEQACGETGPGRMLEPESLVEGLAGLLRPRDFDGVAVTITAGPTREALDPVRFLSNHSSGKMGFALAAAARARGARVRLVAGPVALDTPVGIERIDVESAEQMLESVLAGPGDLFIGCAAVADYRPGLPAAEKIKKQEARITLELERNPDILAAVAGLAQRPFAVGFAAETQDLVVNARNKLRNKHLDLIAANLVGERAEGRGFNSDYNALHVIWEGGDDALPLMRKSELAHRLLDRVRARMPNGEKV
ncbi:bifunctional phosphopantothenoylcysteine decarboxylase/phosphopantothenate--cysteine ligase CoaBC [Thiohalomonas denitrificans]|uniref:Coenzyme A biosynthesis bifunctional protein CoaBC n=1 Tax=Thiohalomonas denitrificans TaxID=415747 RepID=A0A1G5QK69_9GAMM|nr:bifunctional phosphopantothenoylcysteine decarboxylase/phosphopantothenate--cysteine ligase CoaBC [Thiohalomonas denitrificans]SCZ61996.1 phosphopantothenoylcysteine decarboxylase / phosphopantothenate--cysteine ligase [Thiohalomonas denitrificans]